MQKIIWNSIGTAATRGELLRHHRLPAAEEG